MLRTKTKAEQVLSERERLRLQGDRPGTSSEAQRVFDLLHPQTTVHPVPVARTVIDVTSRPLPQTRFDAELQALTGPTPVTRPKFVKSKPKAMKVMGGKLLRSGIAIAMIIAFVITMTSRVGRTVNPVDQPPTSPAQVSPAPPADFGTQVAPATEGATGTAGRTGTGQVTRNPTASDSPTVSGSPSPAPQIVGSPTPAPSSRIGQPPASPASPTPAPPRSGAPAPAPKPKPAPPPPQDEQPKPRPAPQPPADDTGDGPGTRPGEQPDQDGGDPYRPPPENTENAGNF